MTKTHSDHIRLRSALLKSALRSFVFSLLLFLLVNPPVSAFRTPYFSKLSVEDGLSQSTVFSVCQDSLGMMWFGTMDGLSRYDGYDFKLWRRTPGDSTSISSDIVRHVFVDGRGRLWAGTSEGLSLYRRATDSFNNWYVGDVSSIAPADDGQLFVVAGGKLSLFNPETGLWSDCGLGGGVVPQTLCRDGAVLWISSTDGALFRCDPSSGEIRKVPELQSSAKINAIFPYGECLWVSTEGAGLWRLEMSGRNCIGATNFTQKDGLPSNFVRSLQVDESGCLWIGTYGGLCILEDGVFNNVYSDAFKEGSLSQNSVRSICRDNQGGMWLGTYYGGVNYYHPLRNHFRSIRRMSSGNSLNDNVVNCITEDASGRLWIGTNTGGVNCWDTERGTFRTWAIASGFAETPESNDVKAMWVDDRAGRIWVGAHAGGLSYISLTDGSVRKITSGDYRSPMNVYSIIPGDGNLLWIGLLEGLRVYDRKSGKLSFPKIAGGKLTDAPHSARALLRDSSGLLWVGGEDGLSVYHCEGAEISPESRIAVPKALYVQDLHEIPGKSLWAATRNGLWCLDEAKGEWTRYSEQDGLPTNVINGVESDDYGMIWLSTDRGVCRFNPFSKTFCNFTVEDGLPGNQFNPGSSLRRRSGDILFGGIDGMTSFSPEELSDNPYSPSPTITDFRLSGAYSSERIFPENEEIRLSHDKNSFSISFSVPNYLSGHHNSFAYILEGYDSGWTETSENRTASWSNLPHGHYVFRLKAANNGGKWCEKPVELRIYIRPVWYMTGVARLVFALVVLLSLAAVYLRIVKRKDRQKKEELEIQQQAHQEELQQMKTRFFINVSHEMRTPLMLIINPLEEMIARCNDLWMRRRLKYLDSNARRLLHLVNQLLDYRRAELGVFRLSVRPEPVMKIVKENWAYFEEVARKKKLKYRLESSIGDATALVDAQYLELILNNLLSNAFKYTETGSVTLYASLTPEEFMLRISDTGIGIPKDKQEQIFERFYQVERDNIGSGIGLSLVRRLVQLHHGNIELVSELGQGSTFTITIPQKLSAYTEQELGGSSRGLSADVKERFMLEADEGAFADSGSEAVGVPEEAGGSLLIAEDNEEIAAYLRESLSDSFDIHLAKDGEQALAAIGESLPDLVITDLNMPVMDGVKLCSRLKQNVETADIPVIMISSSTDAKDQLAAFKAGADDFMSKPFPLSILQVKIRNMLRTRSRVIDKVSRSSEPDAARLGLSAYDEELLTKAASIVEKNMDNADFSTEDFAAQMGMSRSNLHLKLKALTGESALDFIRRIRFKEACRLLKDGRYSISVISDLVGFNSPSYFATCFKRYMGCLPTEWGRKGGK